MYAYARRHSHMETWPVHELQRATTPIDEEQLLGDTGSTRGPNTDGGSEFETRDERASPETGGGRPLARFGQLVLTELQASGWPEQQAASPRVPKKFFSSPNSMRIDCSGPPFSPCFV